MPNLLNLQQNPNMLGLQQDMGFLGMPINLQQNPNRQDYRGLQRSNRQRANAMRHNLQPQQDQTALQGIATLTGLIPGLGDVTGLAADAEMYATRPDTRNWKSYVLTALGALPFIPSAAAILGGKGAKMADMYKLEAAQDMAKREIPREQIWQETGWFQAPDGQWKFEIDDSQFGFNPENIQSFPASYVDDAMADYTGEEAGSILSDAFSGGSLNKVLNHPDLKQAYPIDPVTNIDFMPSMADEGVAGAYGADFGGRITIGADPLKDAGKAKEYALHELQHLVQGKEGFAIGGSPDEFSTFSDMATANDKYKRLAGEAEARAVQKRMNMTPAERKARGFWEDYDVPEADQVVKFDGGRAEIADDSKGLLGGFDDVPAASGGIDSLVAMHNLDVSNFRHSQKMGGIPAPSVAIAKADAPLAGFGDISLIGDQDLIKPGGSTKVFGSDVYSARYPQVVTQLTAKEKDKVGKIFAEPFGEDMYRLPRDANNHGYAYVGDIADEIENKGARALNHNDTVKARFLYERGELPDYRKYESSHDFKEEVRSLTDKKSGEFDQWKDEFFDTHDIETKEKIFKGFTPSGNRKYAEHNLDNVIKEMKKGVRGGENFNYGAGSLRASVTPQFRSISAIKKARNAIRSADGVEDYKDMLNEKLADIGSRLSEYSKYKDSNQFIEMDRNIDRLQEIIKGQSSYSEYYDDVPDDFKREIASYVDELKNAPTEYFEAKLVRGVDFSEFKGAIVPDDTPQDIVDELKKAGVRIETIPASSSSDPKARAEVMKKFKDYFFVGAPVAVGVTAGAIGGSIGSGQNTDI